MAKEKTFESEMVTEYVVADCERLNVREEANKDSAILFTVTAGTRLIGLEEIGEWLHVNTKDKKPKTGYVMRKFVKVI